MARKKRKVIPHAVFFLLVKESSQMGKGERTDGVEDEHGGDGVVDGVGVDAISVERGLDGAVEGVAELGL